MIAVGQLDLCFRNPLIVANIVPSIAGVQLYPQIGFVDAADLQGGQVVGHGRTRIGENAGLLSNLDETGTEVGLTPVLIAIEEQHGFGAGRVFAGQITD